MSRFFSILVLLLANGVLFLCCSSSDDNSTIDEIVIDGGANISLVFEDHPDLDQFKESIENLIGSANSAVQQLMPMNNVTIRVSVNANQTIPGLGIGGFNPGPNEVLIYVDAGFNGLETVLEAELPAMIAHEMHHAKRRRSVGYGNTLHQAVISEGLADHFSIEAIGIAPPRWSTAVQGQELQDWITTASQNWTSSPYDHTSWFFGSATIPQWTGYSIGYELVKNYLENHPERKPSNLDNEPSSSFLP